MTNTDTSRNRFPLWAAILIPIVLLGALIVLIINTNPIQVATSNLPPVEELSIQLIDLPEPVHIDVHVTNAGPDPLTIAQVLVDEAYWQFEMEPGNTLGRLESGTIHIRYPWVETEPHEIVILTSTGTTFSGEIELATTSPQPGINQFLAYGLVGVYVGIIPVGLGMLWFPAMRRIGRKWLGGILALTVGLLVFLLIDTFLEAFEVAEALPGVFQGTLLVLFAALFTWLFLLAVGSRRSGTTEPRRRGLRLATLIAIGIGLHNLGEGLAIGAAFALGEAALGSFLVIGFTLHNITEGVGIVAPLLPSVSKERDASEEPEANASIPSLPTFVGLMLLAGAPAIFGTWLGGFAFSPVLATLFLGIGAGAIWQVVVEVGALLRRFAEMEGESVTSWINVGGFMLGFLIMYLTAFLVSV